MDFAANMNPLFSWQCHLGSPLTVHHFPDVLRKAVVVRNLALGLHSQPVSQRLRLEVVC